MKRKSDLLNFLYERGYIHQSTNDDGLDELLAAKKVRAYIGFDCTAPSLHVGGLIQIMVLRTLQKFGHEPTVLLGSGTTRVGDPSGKDEMRSVPSEEQIEKNKQSINKVFAQFINFDQGATSVDNADWLLSLNYLEFLSQYGRHFSVNRMLTFDSVKIRLDRRQPLTFLEFSYMLLQAYDFLELHRKYNCTLQLGGSDQWGNIVNGIELIKRVTGNEVFGLTSPLLTTASGAKMGKTASGAVWLNEDMLSNYDYWQFWRNVDDADVIKFLKLFTELPIAEIDRMAALQGAELNEAKIVLANEATTLCRGKEAAKASMETARSTFGGGIGEDLQQVELEADSLKDGIPAFKLFVAAGLCASGGEARRLINGNGAKINNEIVAAETELINGSYVQDGKIKLTAGKKKHAIVVIV
ncbi:MAG: tyrosine--tRNA ligase [Candidatus Midichloria mitochondrii]|uniref:Tyrosine--tRNA ligase n=1 Tax=Midichloria mitochondrii (strain IricVA) TaxID=696127 RepID=F7XTZ7_MIDMI|nr:tyrosine--tRNA ligase [Candidatus Midichloria mitochondrii]AEI89356.1 tyrosyl-tRNA synthetase [Candidatus Midichloria mitochondrii IricVA]MDJ1256406.1 tyrosine--tRNA ligase [Candidatus Midichloria mitochondrii]MDJ1288111.1 tyrosine--tRNA ligase [Candidatus Midichloria mitochondrii]MDJ1298950.1 tyrosine--tRNA ligase [Candidatus Midichloria mitochondrii]MDJ1313176.1 tyrosine--tRNA ligase [Candidatus Midichloria mitochondrii]